MSEKESITWEQVMEAIVDLSLAHKAVPGKMSTAWVCEVNDTWQVAVNGSGQEEEVKPDSSSAAMSLTWGGIGIWFNGWPAAIWNPTGGDFVDGAEANVNAFLKAVEEHVREMESDKRDKETD